MFVKRSFTCKKKEKKGTKENLWHNGSTISLNLSKLGGVWKRTNQESAIRVPVRLIPCSHFHGSWPQHAPLGIDKPWQHEDHTFLSRKPVEWVNELNQQTMQAKPKGKKKQENHKGSLNCAEFLYYCVEHHNALNNFRW